MALIDVEQLLQEVSAEDPCGENLEYDSDYSDLERAARGKEEHSMGDVVVAAEEPNWADVGTRAASLLARSKDLRIVSYLARAQLHTDGVEGFAAGLGLLRQLLERYWDNIYPQLDAEDDNDPTVRVNSIMSFCDADSVIRALRVTPLVQARGFGPVSYRDIAIASGELSPGNGAGEEGLDPAAIEAAFAECDLDVLQGTQGAVRAALDHVAVVEKLVTEKVSAANAPDLDGLTHMLSGIDRVLTEKVSARTGDGETVDGGDDVAASEEGGGAAGRSGPIRSREDVVRAIDRICEYYQRNEPSSPVPLLLRRARRLVAKDFMEILRDMVPDGVTQAETITGEQSDGSSGSYD
jgi:type VI secretion system protein ImpA